MIGPIDDVLQRLLAQSGAIAAVVWIQRSDPATATALTSCPAGLIAAGYDGSAREDIVTDLVQHNPAHLAVAVPPALRVHLPQTPTAAQTFQLGGSNLFLILIWGERSTTGGVDRPTRHLIDHDVSRLALLAELSRSDHDDAERMRAMLDHLDEGVVAVNPVLGRADINPAAAKFLGLAPGRVPVAAFAEAMARFIGRATNRSDSAEANRHQGAGTESPVESTWRFTEQPTHVRVRAHPLAGGTDGGRIWEFADVSAIEGAREESEHSRAVTKAATDALLDPMVTLTTVRDGSGQIVDFAYSLVNEATVEYLGTPREELLGRGVVELMPGLKAELLEEYIRCLQTGEPLVLNDFSYDNEILDDTRRYDIRASRSTPNSLTLTWRDVTERFLAAQDLEKAHALLQASANATLDPYLLAEAITDPSGEIVDLLILDVNDALCDFIGLPAHELVNHNVLDIWPNLAGSELMARYAACATTGEPLVLDDVEYLIERLTTTRRYDIRGAQVRPGLITLTYRDVTDRFETAQQILKSEERLRLITENVGSVVSRIGPDGTYLWVSGSVQDILGAPPEYYIGRKVWEFVAPDDTDNDTARRHTISRGEPFSGRARILDAHATPHWVHLVAKPFIDAAGNPDGFVATFSLIDDQVAAEQRAARAEKRHRSEIEEERALLRASTDSMLNPQVLFEAIRDSDGRVVDFSYRSVNRAAETYLHVSEEHLLGRTALDTLPGMMSSGLLARYGRCLNDGQPVVLTDFAYFNEMLDAARRYDIRGTKAGSDLLTLTWSDVTERFQAARRIAASEEKYRLLAENSSDAVVHVRDGKVAWVSPAIEKVLAAPPQYWAGRKVREVVPPEDIPDFERRWASLEKGGSVQQRIRVKAVDGVTHWVHLHAAPFRDAEGRQDGVTAALRLIDDEVAAEQQLAEAREQRARADALYRQSVEHAAIGTCLADLDGNFVEVNPALCSFFGYEPDELLRMTWLDLTAPDYLQADLDRRSAVMAGDIDSYRMTKEFIHADGHPIWGDLSVSCIRGADGAVEVFIGQITDITDEVRSREELERARRLLTASADSMLNPQVLLEAIRDSTGRLTDFRFVSVNQACRNYLKVTQDELIGHSVADSNVLDIESSGLLGRYAQCLETGQPVILDDFAFVNEMLDNARRYDIRATRAGTELLSLTWSDVTERYKSARQLKEAGDLLRASTDGMIDPHYAVEAITDPAGNVVDLVLRDANLAFCDYLGVSRSEVVDRSLLAVFPNLVSSELMAHYAHCATTGEPIELDDFEYFLDPAGPRRFDIRVARVRPGLLTGTIRDVTERFRAAQLNDELNSRLREELQSAARYMSTIMPAELTGAVNVSSRYLPSQELGGDCFDYRWIDDEHLVIYLIDVSGHGLEPALLAVSLQNILRSGTLGAETMLDPAAVLTELNRLFQMEQQNEHYFTLWYGVYENATRALRYSTAAAPPAYAFSHVSGDLVTATELMTRASPVGAFSDTEFTASSFHVPPGCRILLYSDGASELPLRDGGYLRQAQFEALATGVAGSPDWSLDDLTGELRDLTPDGAFQDDVSLIRVAFD